MTRYVLAKQKWLLKCTDRNRLQIYDNMSHEQFASAAHPKVHGSWNLHQHLPRDLDFFVMLASTASVIGSRAQASYAAGNTFMDALARHRRALGLAGCTIDVGKMKGVGYLAEQHEGARALENTASWGIMSVYEQDLLLLLQAAIANQTHGGESVPAQVIMGLGTDEASLIEARDRPWWLDDVKFALILQSGEASKQLSGATDEEAPLTVRIKQTTTDEEAHDVMSSALARKLARAMMIDAGKFH